MKSAAAIAIIALVASLPCRARAVEQLLPGRMLTMHAAASGRQRTLFLARSTAIVAPARGGPDDPTVVGATLALRAASGESAAFDLPASNWSVNAAGTAYKFRNPGAPTVRMALVKDHATVRVGTRATGITLDEPSQGSIAVLFTSGTLRYCAYFGGTVVRDQPGSFIARNAPPPPSCGSSTTTTTSTAPTTTTTTTTS